MKAVAKPRAFRGITGNVLTFGFVSFLTDASSEMIYPLLPAFLTTVLGAGPAFLGVIEGVAESTAAALKLLSGIWSDRVRNRARLVLAGYSLSSCSRPLVAAATSAYHVLFIRFADRVGKGLRTSPRDAMIADEVDPALRGKAFGFQRSLDHAGAVVGPLLATALLTWWIRDLRTLFWLASVPGFFAVLLILLRVREHRVVAQDARVHGARHFSMPQGTLRAYLLILLLFTLGNSTDAFLLLRAGQLGVPVAQLPLIWVALHVVKMASTMPLGAWSDRLGRPSAFGYGIPSPTPPQGGGVPGLGRRRMILAGWSIYALAYAGFAIATRPWHAWALFALYGVFYGSTEGTERALMTDLAPPQERGAAFGWYHGIVGIGALPASILFGLLWQRFGAAAAFSVGAMVAACAAVLLVFFVRPASPTT